MLLNLIVMANTQTLAEIIDTFERFRLYLVFLHVSHSPTSNREFNTHCTELGREANTAVTDVLYHIRHRTL